MNRMVRTAAVGVAFAVPAAGVGPLDPPALAAPPGRASVLVTIAAHGAHLSGEVRSLRLACKDDRTVVVREQVGARGGGDDVRLAVDVTQARDGGWMWSTGSTDGEGAYYAWVRARPGCRAAVSATVRTTRDD